MPEIPPRPGTPPERPADAGQPITPPVPVPAERRARKAHAEHETRAEHGIETAGAAVVRQVREEIALLEAKTTAKEVASKYIGKHAVPWIVLLVAIGVGASYFLDSSALPAVIGLVSTAVMALIALVTGITGIKEKEDKPEFAVIRELIARLDQPKEAMRVNIEDDKVTVTHGGDVIGAARVKQEVGPGGGLKLEPIPVPGNAAQGTQP